VGDTPGNREYVPITHKTIRSTFSAVLPLQFRPLPPQSVPRTESFGYRSAMYPTVASDLANSYSVRCLTTAAASDPFLASPTRAVQLDAHGVERLLQGRQDGGPEQPNSARRRWRPHALAFRCDPATRSAAVAL